MSAGQGAYEQSRRAADRVAKLKDDLDRAEKQQRAWEAGAAGERLVAEQMDSLGVHGWTALHDVLWPGRPKANLDHVLVGPGGIVVVDTKNWTGNVTVVDGVLRQNGYRRDTVIESSLQQASAVAALLEPMHRPLVRSMVCMASQPDMQFVDGTVPIIGINHLAQNVLALSPGADPATMGALKNYLAATLTASQSPEQITTKHVSASADPARTLGSSHARANRNPARKKTSVAVQIVTALSTLIAGLGGAFLVGWLGLKGIREERASSAADAKAALKYTQKAEHDVWLRGEKQRLYISFLVSTQTAKSFAYDIYLTSPRIWNEQISHRFNGTFNDMLQPVKHMMLLCPELAAKANKAFGAYGNLIGFLEASQGPRTPASDKQFEKAIHDTMIPETDFIYSARVDLGISAETEIYIKLMEDISGILTQNEKSMPT